MKKRIENLGDYNAARIMLQKRNGDLSALITEFKNIGAHDALPKQLGIGALIGASIILGGQYVIKKTAMYVKKYKQEKLEKENVLKNELEVALAIESEDSKKEEPLC